MPDLKERTEQSPDQIQADRPHQSARGQGNRGPLVSVPGEARELDDSAIVRSAFQAITENPRQAKELTDCFVRLMAARDPEALATYADAER